MRENSNEVGAKCTSVCYCLSGATAFQQIPTRANK